MQPVSTLHATRMSLFRRRENLGSCQLGKAARRAKCAASKCSCRWAGHFASRRNSGHRMQELRNRGFSVLRATAPTDTATIIVVGVARSGTSMVASALRAMGVFLGDQVHDSVYEDIEIAAALEERNDRLLTELIDFPKCRAQNMGLQAPGILCYYPRS